MFSKDFGKISRNRYTYSIDINDQNKIKYMSSNNIRNEFLGNLNNKFLFNTENNSRTNINKSINSARVPLSNIHSPISIYKPDFQNIQINFENGNNGNSYYNKNINDLKNITPQYNSHVSSITNSFQSQSYSNYNSNNSLYDKNFDNRNKNQNTFSCLSDLTKEKLKQIELSRKINDYNLIENDLSYKRNNKYLNTFKSKPYNTNYKVFYNDKSFEKENNEEVINNEKKEKGILNKKIKGKIKRSTIPKKQNNNYFNEPLNTSRTIPNRENDELEKEKNKYKKEEKNLNDYKNDNQQFKNENQFNKQSLTMEKSINEHLSEYSQRKILNKTLESEFNKFLKDENKKLKEINYAYKQLIDTFFYFINNLSHKFSYYKQLFELKYYLNHLDDLSKNLIGLEHCILTHSTNLNEKNIEKINNINEKEIIKNCKLSIPLKLINEISFQIPDPIEYQKKINELQTFVNKLNQPLFSFKTNKNIFKDKIKEEIKEEEKEDNFEKSENKEDNFNESTNTINSINNISNLNDKKDHDCFACTLGCSVSKRGYSTMAYNPYMQKSYSSRSKSPSYRKENLNIFQKNNKKSPFINIDSNN